jgi:hypothetical protein
MVIHSAYIIHTVLANPRAQVQGHKRYLQSPDYYHNQWLGVDYLCAYVMCACLLLMCEHMCVHE